MLYLKPHKAQIISATENKVGVVNNVPKMVSIGFMDCMISPTDSSAAVTEFMVETKRGYKLLMDILDADRLKYGDHVKWDDREFLCVSPVKKSKHGLPTDHAKILLEEMLINDGGDEE